jgi:hypothetical protein
MVDERGRASVLGSCTRADAGDMGISKAGESGPFAKASNEVGWAAATWNMVD